VIETVCKGAVQVFNQKQGDEYCYLMTFKQQFEGEESNPDDKSLDFSR